MKKIALLSSASAMLLASLSATGASAQDAAQDQDAVAAEEIVITGSRRAARSPADAPSPVDVISAEQFQNQSDGDIGNLLRTLVPSYNVRSESISDAATLVRPANLRGLPSDSTLILLNGKRRHRAAVISFLGAGLSDGAQGPDISVIPSIALERVDVLRDGAAAQYGADAIAGVINFVLKNDAEGGQFEAKYGSTYDGDGDNYQLSGNLGLPVTDDGYINLSFEYREADETVRSVQRTDAQALIDAGNDQVRQPFAQTFGSPNVDDDYKLFFNFGVQASDVAEIYAFGNYAQRDVDGGFFFRNPDDRTGVFDDGTGTRLIQDLIPDDGIACPVITVADGQAALDDLIANRPDCFVFNSIFPGGFTPRFGGQLNDIAATGGVRGEFDFGLTYDLSAGAGRNEVEFFINNTVNAALGAASPTDFDLGAYIQLEKQVNLDLTYPIDVDYFASPLNVAVGFEWREEQFEIETGDPTSFATDLSDQGFTPGSNGFSGFSPDIAGTFDRKNVAFYIDLEADVTEDLVIGVAGRLEDFTDFGTTTNGKFSALYTLNDYVRLRGTYSTGFRAPTPGQSNVTNTTTVFVDTELVNRGTIPPTTPLATQFGGQQLGPEESRSFTVGTALSFGDLDLTVDFFRIKVSDRIAQTRDFEITPQEAAQLEAQGITGASAFASFRFFTNDFSTRTRGIDIVATYPLDLFGGNTDIAFTGNWTETEVTGSRNNLIDELRRRQIEESLPEIRGSLTLTHQQDWFRGLVRLNYFDDYTEFDGDNLSREYRPGSEFTADIEVAAEIMEGFELAAGASNIFDNDPDENPFQGNAGQRFPELSPFGVNGGSWYVRARYSF